MHKREFTYQLRINQISIIGAITLIMLLTWGVEAQECQPFRFDTTYTECMMKLEQCISTPGQHLQHNNRQFYKVVQC
jgi:hypothetical protein